MHQPGRSHGFTLVELMITAAVIGVFSMALASTLESQKRFYDSNERTVETQEDARLVLDLLKFDTRMAGFMVSPVAAIASFDGGPALPDRLCVSSSAGFDLSAAGEQTSLNDRVERYLVDAGNVTSILPPDRIQVTSLDLDGDDDGVPGEVDFVEQGGIIISDGTTSHCAAIAAGGVDAGTRTIRLNPAHPMPATGFNMTSVRAVPAVIYELPNAAAGGTGLTRNGTLMSTTIEDLQAEFWSTTTPPGSPIHDLDDPVNGSSPAALSRVRITVVSTSPQSDTGSTKTYGTGGRPAIANRNAGPADNLQRRLFTASIRPRNISLVP